MHNVGFSLPSLRSFALTSCSSFLPPQFLSGPVASECSPVGDLHPVKMEMSRSKAIPCLVAELRFQSGVYTASAWLYSLKKLQNSCYHQSQGFSNIMSCHMLGNHLWLSCSCTIRITTLTHVLLHKNITPCPPQPPVAPVKHCIYFLNPSEFQKPSAINFGLPIALSVRK